MALGQLVAQSSASSICFQMVMDHVVFANASLSSILSVLEETFTFAFSDEVVVRPLPHRGMIDLLLATPLPPFLVSYIGAEMLSKPIAVIVRSWDMLLVTEPSVLMCKNVTPLLWRGGSFGNLALAQLLGTGCDRRILTSVNRG